MESVQEKIIVSTIQCIEKYGIENVTIRAIGKEAAVNSAAINYYFKSKENLISMAMDTTLEHAFDWNDYVFTENEDAAAQLKYILNKLVAGALKFPNITKAHINDAFRNNDYKGKAIKKINEFVNNAYEKMRRGLPGLDRDRLKITVHQIFSAGLTQFMTLPHFLEDFLGRDLCDSSFREQYISELVDSLL